MKIKRIQIENYRLLKNFEIDIEEKLSLVIGKNNTGKTSFLTILDKFLNKSEQKKFSYEDFNLDFRKELCKIVTGEKAIAENEFVPVGLKLRLVIQYFEDDNLANINRLMMDLDPDNNFIVLGFEYTIDYTKSLKIISEYVDFVAKEKDKKAKNDSYSIKSVDDFLSRKQGDYFKPYRKSIDYNIKNGELNEAKFIDLDKEKIPIKDVLNFKFVSAKRDVSNKEIDKTLSNQTSKIYRKSEESDEQKDAIEEFKDTLSDTDKTLSDIYSTLFKDVVETVKKFGGIKEDESIIEILSTLQHRELLEGNTTVMYNHSDSKLPESFNGLGYMNLISMLFELKIILQEFKRKKDEVPADINLLFIEEPEAHTHPQMQYVFINNIKAVLDDGVKREDGLNRELQYIVSTHSSHIVSESDFNDIKYLKKESTNAVIANSLKSLEAEYIENGEENNFRFLTQYLTLNRAELFFADKAILIEGDTERILLPAMMKKIDGENPDGIPLLSQNISIVEVGAYSQIFERFIDFIGIRTVIITDIDSQYLIEEENDGKTSKVVKKCPSHIAEAETSSNASLKFFFGANDLEIFSSKEIKDKRLSKIEDVNGDERKWQVKDNGHLLIIYQTAETGYGARSFEDAFFHINKKFLEDNRDKFPSLTKKWIDKFLDDGDACDVFEFSEKAVGKKPPLAIEILLNSKDKEFSNWEIPAYIKEGLLWLKQD
jgi:predicted ATP-dependent endonuclease of OLD family